MRIKKLIFLVFFSIIIIATTSFAQHTNYRTSTKKNVSEFDNKFIQKNYGSNNSINNILQKYLLKFDNTNSIDSVVSVETNGNKSKILLTHNETGKVTYKLEQKNDGSGWTNYSQTFYGYDENENNTEYQFDYWENGDWEPYRRSVGEFDVNGNQILLIDEAYSDGTWEKSSRYSWEFDGSGNTTVFLINTGRTKAG